MTVLLFVFGNHLFAINKNEFLIKRAVDSINYQVESAMEFEHEMEYLEWIADTIIIDDEYIYIEKEDLITNLDSVEQECLNDVKKIRKNFHLPGNFSICTGPNATFSKYGTSITDQQPLDVYLGRNNSNQYNLSYGCDAGLNLFSFSSQGEKRLSLHAGVTRNKMKFLSTVFTDENQLMQDSLLHFYKENGEMILEYFFFTDWPNGEIDTVHIAVQEKVTEVKTLNFPVRLRWLQSIGSSPWSWFGEVGIVYRNIRKKQEMFQNNFLINDEAEFSKLGFDEFKVSSKVLPIFGLGMKYYFDKRENKNSKLVERINAGFMFQTVLPRATVNSSAMFYFDAWSLSLNLFVGFNF